MRCWRCDGKVDDHAPACRSCGAALIRGDQPTPREVALTLAGGIGSPWATRATSRWVLWTRVSAVLALVVSPVLFGLTGTWTLRRAVRSREPGSAEARSLLHACIVAGVIVNAVAYAYFRSH
jgi:hypothetical protein